MPEETSADKGIPVYSTKTGKLLGYYEGDNPIDSKLKEKRAKVAIPIYGTDGRITGYHDKKDIEREKTNKNPAFKYNAEGKILGSLPKKPVQKYSLNEPNRKLAVDEVISTPFTNVKYDMVEDEGTFRNLTRRLFTKKIGITGAALFIIVTGIYATAVNSIKREDYSDVIIPDTIKTNQEQRN
ncbi:hypothetical protein AKO1_004346 [Acrasis kona]|uniref:Uncharacterized protein n=1 Tax=Acrasis kona TaxID=1008807 RepID=A0AAW2Z6V1_9EUKA